MTNDRILAEDLTRDHFIGGDRIEKIRRGPKRTRVRLAGRVGSKVYMNDMRVRVSIIAPDLSEAEQAKVIWVF